MSRLQKTLCAATVALLVPAAAPAAEPTLPPGAVFHETKLRLSPEEMEKLVVRPLRLAEEGDMAGADSALARLLAETDRRQGPGSIEAADLVTAFMITLFNTGLRQEAMTYRVRALDAVRRAWGSDHLEYALVLNDLVVMDRKANGDAVGAGAEEALLEAYRIRSERLGETHPETIATLIYLGDIQSLKSRTGGEFTKAAPAFATLQKAVVDADRVDIRGYTDNLWARTVLAQAFVRNGALQPGLQTFRKMLEKAQTQGVDGASDLPFFLDTLEEAGFKKEAEELARSLFGDVEVPMRPHSSPAPVASP